MSTDPELGRELLNALGASGFPFQTAIARAIKDTGLWNIDSEEFPWRDNSGADQFVDIVCSHGAMTVVVECKKTTKEKFIFLKPSGRAAVTQDVRCVYTIYTEGVNPHMNVNCGTWTCTPSSVEADFCVINTSTKATDQRLLERDARLVVGASEAYGRAIKAVFQVPDPAKLRQWPIVPMIVTNAPLFVATYDAALIDLETGVLASNLYSIEPAKWVRFRKAFTSEDGLDNLGQTVFVVNASTLTELLQQLSPWRRPLPQFPGTVA